MFEVIQAGWGNTLQDEGRHNCRQWGLGNSGPLDEWHFAYANLLAGNQRRKNALEIRRGPLTLLAHQSTPFSICGYGFTVLIDNNKRGNSQNCLNFRAFIKAGEHLTIQPNQPSGTAYLAVQSGFIGHRWQADNPAGEAILGSLSADLTAKLGRPLQKGDKLSWLNETENIQTKQPLIGIRPLPLSPIIRAIEGPEHHLIPIKVQRTFWESRWQVSREQSRMAVRLHPIDKMLSTSHWPNVLTQLPSHAVLPGTVQLPSPETPIILLAESQTTGGYPRIASVIQADLWKLAHFPLGVPIYWQKVSLQEALKKWKKQSQHLQRLNRNLRLFSSCTVI